MLEQRMAALSEKAMRVLAFATSDNRIGEHLLQDMTFVGMVGIRDELRPEAVEAIKTAKRAGIQVVMVTGDKKETAAAIARTPSSSSPRTICAHQRGFGRPIG